MTAIIEKGTPAAEQAVAEFNAVVGYDIRVVFSDDTWAVMLVDGEPQVVVNADGMRTMARFAPRSDALEVAEQVIELTRRPR